MFERDGILLADNEFVIRGDDEPPQDISVRYRTVGDMTCTGAVESTATSISECPNCRVLPLASPARPGARRFL